MKTHSDRNKATTSKTSAKQAFFSGKEGDKNSFFNINMQNIEASPFFKQIEESSINKSGDSFTKGQVVTSEARKNDHIAHPTGTETNPNNNGHLDERISENHTVFESGGKFRVRINKIDLHTQVFIQPEDAIGRWDSIEDFVNFYDTPYNPSFNLYEGTLRHENQHVVEAAYAYNKNAPKFRTDVAAINEATQALAESKYQAVFASFHTQYQADYWANGEVDGYRIEWDYYHSEFEKFVADPISYGIFDWVIFDSEAAEVLDILDKLRSKKKTSFDKMVNSLKSQGVLNNLLNNISDGDKKKYKNVISDIYLLL